MAKKVLVVDDEKLIVKGIRFSLLQDGMEVDCAYDGQEALDMAMANEYDMILLDVMLPKMDGFEVCQRIREFSNMPIVMLTAKGDDMDKILGLEYGADDFLVFGRETKGLPEELLRERYDECVRIPMRKEARSLNLSNSVAIVLYEALRQQGFPGLKDEGSLTGMEMKGDWRDYV